MFGFTFRWIIIKYEGVELIMTCLIVVKKNWFNF